MLSSLTPPPSSPVEVKEERASPEPLLQPLSPPLTPEKVKQEGIPTTPHISPVVANVEIPEEEFICYCHRPAINLHCYGEGPKPENVGKDYFKCAKTLCDYWIWVETQEEFLRLYDENLRSPRNSTGSRGLNLPDFVEYELPTDEELGKFKCDCGVLATRKVAQINPLALNCGAAYYKCDACKAWLCWEDGSKGAYCPTAREVQGTVYDGVYRSPVN
jgi:hypothetical protein